MTAPRFPGSLLGRAHQIALAIVPAPRRSEWSREWHAELWHLCRKSPGRQPHPVSLARGMLADALWLRADSIRVTSPGSASLCLLSLVAACLVVAAAELIVAGSLHAFTQTVIAHFCRNYVCIAIPAILAAVITHPVRPMRRDNNPSREGLVSMRTRRALFLGARVALTLTLAFFAILFVLSPFHFAGRLVLGWAELILDAVTITASLRHILLNQEQRCQRCLHTLGQPTRVGPPSRNFLYWSGTELACAEGHGMLQIPAMRGSWCWYDRWIEDDAAWLLVSIQP
ncbi:MAG TPA: hypothetical protein VL346_00615 [Acidobacteriaceae bacterium]|nr:hypothetical protein [Acidobacteriaceae bacterium]